MGGHPDRLAHIPELARYDCFAVDAHRHGAAAHDARHEGAKRADGHFYSYGTGLGNFEKGFVRMDRFVRGLKG